MSSTACSGTALAVAGWSGRTDTRLAVDLGRSNDLAEQRPRGALGDRDVVPAIGMQEPQRVLGAMPDIGVAADRRHGQDVELRARQREPDRQRVVQARVAVDDQRQRVLGRTDRGRPRVAAAL